VDKTEVVYGIRIDETESITIDVSRIEGVFPATITVIAEDGEELASSDTIERVDDRYYRILADVTLPEAGRYTVVATRNDDSTEPFEFRLNIRRASDADPIEAQDTESSDADDSAVTAQNDTPTSTSADTSELVVGVEEGNLAPNFATTTLAGEAVSLEELRGQVVLINFWGTWCGPCIREMPELQQVYDNRADEGFTILALATRGDTAEDVADFRDRFELTFPLIVDEGDAIFSQYLTNSRPSTYIVDQNGVIVFKHLGPVIESQIDEILVGLLES
ncbi:MAG: TlpA disulfide reductase family protein, partial [Chloroflexota bacterium]